MAARFSVALLNPASDRTGFDSGVEPLDRYFREQVGQDIRRRVAACFVATDQQGGVAGFYTLASASVALNELPEGMSRKLPRYPSVPAVRMGRLAVHRAHQGQGLGAALLADALRRAATAEIAAYALLVDAKDDAAVAFYAHHGFIALPDRARTLLLPLATVKPLVAPSS